MDNIDKSDPSLALTLPVQLTRTLHRQPYDYILPEHNPQPGKIIVITGGGSGIGAVSLSLFSLVFHHSGASETGVLEG